MSKRHSARALADAQRHRTLARSLGLRVYITPQRRLMLVGGAPDAQKLGQRLSRVRRAPQSLAAASPLDLGFGAIIDGELTEHALLVRARALDRWRRAIEQEIAKRHLSKARRRELDAERQEITALHCRFEQLLALCRRADNAAIAGSDAWWLDAVDEAHIAGLLRAVEGSGRLPPQVRWLVRLVGWIGGRSAASDYVANVVPLVAPMEHYDQAVQLAKFMQQLHTWKQRSAIESHAHLLLELRDAIGRLPQRLCSTAKIGWKSRGRTFNEHCDKLIERCREAIPQPHDTPALRIAAALAALASVGGLRSPLPPTLLERMIAASDASGLIDHIDALRAEVGEPGYDRLLAAARALPELPLADEWHSLRCLLVAGASSDDLAWAKQHRLLVHLPQAHWPVTQIRAFLQEVAQRELLDDAGMVYLVCSLQRRSVAEVLAEFRAWLTAHVPKRLPRRLAQLVRSAMYETLLTDARRLTCHEAIRQWASVPPLPLNEDEPGEISDSLRAIAEKLVAYRQLAGRPPRLPHSLRKQLTQHRDQLRELSYLQSIIATGEVTPGQKVRCEHLADKLRCATEPSTANLLRKAEELLVIAAVDALRAIIARAAAREWNMKFALPRGLSLSRTIDFVEWLSEMDGTHRRLLRHVLAAHAAHGAIYKRALPLNRAWLRLAEAQGLNLAAWLSPVTAMRMVEGKRMRVEVCCDPWEVFQMGSHFHTCLSLGDSNQMSALTNAYDANKHVIYLRDERGVPVARQLLAISEDWKLLGYACYRTADYNETALREGQLVAIAEFCGRWARRVGLPLGDEGKPAALGEHFWYDDGLHPWHDAATLAWEMTAADPSPRLPSATAESVSV